MYSNCAITSFEQMEMEKNVINNKMFIKIYLKIRVRGKEIA